MTKSLVIAFILIGFGLITGTLQQAGIMPADINSDVSISSYDTQGIEDLSNGVTEGGVNALSGITILQQIISVLLQVLYSVFAVGYVLVTMGIPVYFAGPIQAFVIIVYAFDIYTYWKGSEV